MLIKEQINGDGQSQLVNSELQDWRHEFVVLDYGAILYCLHGNADIMVNFTRWNLYEGAVITLFPNDVVLLYDVSNDFQVDALCYTEALLRESSLQLENIVYDSLRADRCRSDAPIVSLIVKTMMSLLRLYFEQIGCICLSQMVMLQLKAFFLGFYDYLYRHPSKKPEFVGSRRAHELFQRFMILLERDYKHSRDVYYYASALNITPKYLNTITHSITNHTTKELIDNYVIMQLKLLLRSTQRSVKEVSWDYHFSSVSFFYRYFRLHTGTTPKQYKQKIIVK